MADTNEHVCEEGPVPMEPNEVQNEGNSAPSSEEEEQSLRKKYGGMLPKKPPLISKDHERAFFDSADWALGKPTSNQQARSRRSAYASANPEDGGNAAPEEMNTS